MLRPTTFTRPFSRPLPLPLLALTIAVSLLFLAAGPVVAAAEPSLSSLTLTPSFTGKGVFHDDVANTVPDRLELTAVLESEVDGTPQGLAGETVLLEQKRYDEDAYSVVAEGVTDEDGRLTLSRWVGRNTSYRFSYAGSLEHQPAVSDRHRLKAMRDLNARVKQDGRRLWLKGPTISPAWKRKPVTFYRQTCKTCKWKRIDRSHSARDGSWKFAAQFPKKVGTWRFRAEVKKTPGFVRSRSATLVARTTPARGARLGPTYQARIG